MIANTVWKLYFSAPSCQKQEQIDNKLADREDPSSIFDRYVVKFGPFVFDSIQILFAG